MGGNLHRFFEEFKSLSVELQLYSWIPTGFQVLSLPISKMRCPPEFILNATWPPITGQSLCFWKAQKIKYIQST